ncbi:MAG: foldase protein PrsA [Solirubrobacteraceae bacterium]|nr:foldase protein PrsA [Solirubrobacteraceae bacterium]
MRTRIFLPIAVLAALVAGCGGGIPGNSVATIDGHNITKATYDHWLGIAAKSGGQPNGSIPKPPAFKDCIAAKRKTLPKPAKGQPETTDAQLKTQCDSEYKALQQQVMQLLISFQWIEGEAKDQKVKVTDADVKKQFDTQKKASFPKDADYKKFLEQSGQTEKDILMRVRLDLLSNKIREKITKGLDDVSDAEITKYYNDNKSRFAQPERRDLLVVLTKTEDKANQAKSALQGGEAFAKVAKQFSIDPQSKASGGKLPAVAKGQQEQAFDKAIFSAKKNALTGPVKTQFGFYVFKVTKITAATQQSQQEATATIKQLLASQKQQKALDKFVKDFTKKWKAKTDCKKGYRTSDCSNGPKPTPTPTVGAPGATPVPTTN